jgi:hypothetical protein
MAEISSEARTTTLPSKSSAVMQRAVKKRHAAKHSAGGFTCRSRLYTQSGGDAIQVILFVRPGHFGQILTELIRTIHHLGSLSCVGFELVLVFGEARSDSGCAVRWFNYMHCASEEVQ